MKTYLDLVTEAKPLVDFIDMEQTDAALAQGCELIDVREESEFNAGHLPGALHMSRGVIEGRMGANPRFARHGTHIMLYCRTDARATLTAASLQKMGYTRVQVIVGGFEAWIASGKSVVV